jgi:hypothetical protein
VFPVSLSGTCAELPGSFRVCELTFGAPGFVLAVGAPDLFPPSPTYFRTSLFAQVPEPGTSLLVMMGLAGLAARRRS